jgi:hypothetical protein
VFATVPVNGDSGGWAIKTTTSEWAGLLTAADHLMGYALEADDILAEAQSQFGLKLTVA